jgi:hypothetical protein
VIIGHFLFLMEVTLERQQAVRNDIFLRAGAN